MPKAWALAYSLSGIPVPQCAVSVVACASFFCRATSTLKKYDDMETGTSQQKITLAFINDKSPILDLICKDLIASGIEVLFSSENIKDGLSQLSALKEFPEVLIIDLDFYNKEILIQLQELRIKYSAIKLLAHSDNEQVVKALLDIGFIGYLLIGSDTDDFKKALTKASKD